MCTGFVREVTLPSTCPSRALVEIYDGSLSGRSPSRRARDRSMMLSSAPESTRAAIGWEPEGSTSSPERVGLLGEAESTTELTSIPLVTGELCVLTGTDRHRSVLAGRSTGKGSASVFSPFLLLGDGCDHPAWALDPPPSKKQWRSSGRRRGLLGTWGEEGCVAG